jgi:hypothetical protein
MKTRAAFAVAVLGAAASALAQDTQGSVTWSLQAFRATPATPGNFASGVTIGDTPLTPADTLNFNDAVLLRISFTLSGTPGGVDENFEIFWSRSLPASCYANCDQSTASPVLNVADFTCFLQRFAAADPYANCDASTAQPTLNVADFTCFLQKFAAGCS